MNSLKLQAIGDKVIIKPIKESVHEGVHLVDDETEPIQRGYVVSAGNNVVGLNSGDRILFKRSAGWEFEENKEEFLWMRGENILVKLN